MELFYCHGIDNGTFIDPNEGAGKGEEVACHKLSGRTK